MYMYVYTYIYIYIYPPGHRLKGVLDHVLDLVCYPPFYPPSGPWAPATERLGVTRGSPTSSFFAHVPC